MDFPKDGWAKINAAVKGTGKVVDNTYVEEISSRHVVSINLVTNGVAGEAAAERLSNV